MFYKIKECALQIVKLFSDPDAKNKVAIVNDKITSLISDLDDHYVLALKAANMATWKWDYNKDILSWDDNMFELYEVEKDGNTNLRYQNWRNKVHPDDIEELEKDLFDCIKTQRPFYNIFRIQCSNGEEKYIRGNGRIIDDQLLGVNYDITANIIKENILKENLDKQKILFDKSPIGVEIVDNNFKIIEVNEMFSNMVKYPKEELIGKTFMEITHPDDINMDVELATKMLHKEIPEYRIEKRYITKDGKTIWALLNVKAIWSPDGELSYYIPTVIDITYRKQIENNLNQSIEDLKKANKSKSEFLAMMSHEIRTPMNGIMGMTQLLQETNISEEQKKYIKNIKESGEILLHIIGNVLDLSKIEHGKIDIYNNLFNLQKIFEYIEDLYRSRLNNTVNIKMNIDNNIPCDLIGDEYKIKQILFNLVGNSCKFTKEGLIEIGADLISIKDEFVTINFFVKDTGEGIEEEDLQKILEPFAQADTFSKRKHEGVGLGLTICHRLLNKLDSNLKIESTINEGSEFSFILKMKIANQQQLEQIVNEKGEDPYKLTVLEKCSILIAEDNEMSKEVISGFLTFLGSKDFTIVSNGIEVLNALKEKYYDIIFLDIQMPEMNGFDTAISINKMYSKKEKPFIYALTAHATIENEKNSLSNGMDGYLSKPITLENLKTKLTSCYQALKIRRSDYVN